MSTTTEEIIEKLKTITLFEAAELVSRIEETFGVDASAPAGGFTGAPLAGGEIQEAPEEKTTFDVILEDVAKENRVRVLKVNSKFNFFRSYRGKRIYNVFTESCKRIGIKR